MITVAQALDRLFALVTPLPSEDVPLTQAAGRILSRPVSARRNQPPFAASAMDGYAIRADFTPGSTLQVIGESAAGRGFAGQVRPGQAARIFTGAPLPDGADIVAIQEDVTRSSSAITLGPDVGPANVRPMGADFKIGDTLSAPRRLSASDIALLAAMNIATVPVTRRPIVAIIATGDELVQPGEQPGPDQIIASNSYGLQALLRDLGADPRLLPIARDTLDSLAFTLKLAKEADLILTIGGASVGDHDLVGQAAGIAGMEQAFYKVAMRPGKPLMAGRMGESIMIGLPGNPVSAMVCGHIFVAPVIRVLQGLPAAAAPRRKARLTADLPANGPREHYMRARLSADETLITPFERQDSSLLSILTQADALLVHPMNEPAHHAGDSVDYIPL